MLELIFFFLIYLAKIFKMYSQFQKFYLTIITKPHIHVILIHQINTEKPL